MAEQSGRGAEHDIPNLNPEGADLGGARGV
jgi:hypothetical protein